MPQLWHCYSTVVPLLSTTYVFNLIAAAVRATGKIVLSVTSSGIASLLLTGGRTAHSRFKIPIPCHEDSTCNIKKGDVHQQLLKRTALIIWDEVPMQHRHNLECVDRSLRDLLDVDDDFGGITVLLGGDFRQTLPVVPHGSREQVIGASLVRSRIWTSLQVLHLRQNMRLGQGQDSDQFAAFLLKVGSGEDCDEDNNISLPSHMHCGNDIGSLAQALYSQIISHSNGPQVAVQHSYFLDRIILSAKNTDVNQINSHVLNSFHGEAKIFTSADSVTDKEYEYIA